VPQGSFPDRRGWFGLFRWVRDGLDELPNGQHRRSQACEFKALSATGSMFLRAASRAAA
jgi:hypothetical protein